jgi:putative tryptophan/tyrosine transport system substrate-binding protein
VARIGTLYIGLADSESFKKELQEGLRELGYVEGQNIAFEFRSAEGKLERLPELAAELVRLKVDVIGRSTFPAHWRRSRQHVKSPL